ncbi:Uncharacterised protein [Mycobacterium tuberculosis]|nr:Uncharacterised protein [Mycobacterium tuberculosis]CNN54000.1 Uncharacterised protein [Mycobacterium tuberculosis]CNN62430.1 Uncharacterised protein [Mycobacterium tuberculosis]
MIRDPSGSPRSRPCGPCDEPTVGLALTAWATGLSVSAVVLTQLGGTDRAPILLARAKLADTARLAPRPANCGVGYQAPPEPAVVPPGPKVSCCAIEAKNCAMPVAKYD